MVVKREILSESIRISKSTKKLLDDSKVYGRETYDDVIIRLSKRMVKL